MPTLQIPPESLWSSATSPMNSPLANPSLTTIIDLPGPTLTAPHRPASNPLAHIYQLPTSPTPSTPLSDSIHAHTTTSLHLGHLTGDISASELILPPPALMPLVPKSPFTVPRVFPAGTNTLSPEPLRSTRRVLQAPISPRGLLIAVPTTGRRGRSLTLTAAASPLNNASRYADGTLDPTSEEAFNPEEGKVKGSGDEYEIDLIRLNSEDPVLSHTLVVSTSESDDSEDDEAGEELEIQDERVRRVRAAKKLVRQSTKSRRASGERRTGHTTANGIVHPMASDLMERREQKNFGSPVAGQGRVPTQDQPRIKEAEVHVRDFRALVNLQVVDTIIEFANRVSQKFRLNPGTAI